MTKEAISLGDSIYDLDREEKAWQTDEEPMAPIGNTWQTRMTKQMSINLSAQNSFMSRVNTINLNSLQ